MKVKLCGTDDMKGENQGNYPLMYSKRMEVINGFSLSQT